MSEPAIESLLHHRPLWQRVLWGAAGVISLAIGIVGIFLPLLPTTPLVLLAAFCFSRCSEAWERWLLEHRTFGPMVRDWQAHGAVSRRAKWVSTLTMLACSAIFFLTSPRWWMAALGTAIMACVSVWLWLRPEPPRDCCVRE